MRLLHYSHKPMEPMRSVQQSAPSGYFDKPRGLWVSVEGEDDWRSWCGAESFDLGAIVHEVTLSPEANILRVVGSIGIDDFSDAYGIDYERYGQRGIDWPKVAAEYQGIIIAPYVWARRLDGGAPWYYGWDCASGCIWDAAAVASVTALEPATTD